MLVEIKSFMTEHLDRVGRFESKISNTFTSFENKIREAQEFLEERNQLIDEQQFVLEQAEKEENKQNDVPMLDTSKEKEEDTADNTSFFDNLQ